MSIWEERRSGQFNTRDNDYRSEFHRDRGRMVHSSAFRRLQSKTQVLGLGESDYYRTRLTHSLEVAQIGTGIKGFLERNKDCADYKRFFPDDDLMMTICLGHDLGHPAFGHGGEKALNFSMFNNGGFEGNPQTLRIVSKLEKYINPGYGMDLTRRALLGLLKYPVKYSEVLNPETHPTTITQDLISVRADDWNPPKCYYDVDADVVNWILDPLSDSDKTLFQKFDKKSEEKKHSKSRFKSFDCSIMDLADDIAYGMYDLDDGITLKILTRQKWNDWNDKREAEEKITLEKIDDEWINNHHKSFIDDLFSGDTYKRKDAIATLVHKLIVKTKITENPDFKEEILQLNASLFEEFRDLLGIFQDFIRDNLIRTPEVKRLEYKGQQIVMKLFSALNSDPMSLLPYDTQVRYKESKSSTRVISDYIAGMTDDYAAKIYGSLFNPKVGSVFDKL